MGKSTPTHRDQLRRLEEQWEDYRRMLRRQHQPAFDELFEHARTHADAGGAANPTEPMFSALLSICLEQQLAIDELQTRLDEFDGD